MRTYHWKNKETKELFQAIVSLKTQDEAELFFRDLCTREEIDEMARRWQAVQRLVKEEAYRTIADEVGLSTSTVARVAHWLNHGKGGYRLVLKRLGIDGEKKEENKKDVSDQKKVHPRRKYYRPIVRM